MKRIEWIDDGGMGWALALTDGEITLYRNRSPVLSMPVVVVNQLRELLGGEPRPVIVTAPQPEAKPVVATSKPVDEADLRGAALIGVASLLRHVGEDLNRDGLSDTPDRVIRWFEEVTRGYSEDPSAILARTFDHASDELILVRDIPFVSLCEHHLLPFHGRVTVGYIPGASGKVVGLSKIPRLVDAFAGRLQIQERLTFQIAEALEKNLGARGVGVLVRARHECMTMRGVKKPEADMVTSAMLGVLRSDATARQEFMSLAKL